MIGKLLAKGDASRTSGSEGQSISSALRQSVQRIADAKEASILMKSLVQEDVQMGPEPTPMSEVVGGFQALTETAVNVTRMNMEDQRTQQQGMSSLVALLLQQSNQQTQAAAEMQNRYVTEMLSQAKEAKAQPHTAGVGDKLVEHFITTHPALHPQQAVTPNDPLHSVKTAIETMRVFNEMMPRPEPAPNPNGLTPELIELMKFNSEIQLKEREIGRKYELEERRAGQMDEMKDVVKRIAVPFVQTVGDYLQVLLAQRQGQGIANPAVAVQPPGQYEYECPSCHAVTSSATPLASFTCSTCQTVLNTAKSDSAQLHQQHQPNDQPNEQANVPPAANEWDNGGMLV